MSSAEAELIALCACAADVAYCKHFELRWRFLHHYINRGIVSIKAIKRDLQLADLGTAPRGYPQLQQMGAVIHGEI
jgi:hypothetical protein